MAEREQCPPGWRPDPSAGYIRSPDLAAEMERLWQECQSYSQPVQYIIVPGFWFSRMRPSRRGRRLLKGRWRLSDRYRREIEPYLGREPHTVYAKDRPIHVATDQ